MTVCKNGKSNIFQSIWEILKCHLACGVPMHFKYIFFLLIKPAMAVQFITNLNFNEGMQRHLKACFFLFFLNFVSFIHSTWMTLTALSTREQPLFCALFFFSPYILPCWCCRSLPFLSLSPCVVFFIVVAVIVIVVVVIIFRSTHNAHLLYVCAGNMCIFDCM